jgi:hypothetical protein
MRRILIALVMSGAVVVAAPTEALAAHHHARHHRSSRRHSRVRHERFGSADTSQPGSSGQAGTVTSFADNGNGTGVLTITLNDGTTMVTGTVDNNTELECTSSSSSQQGEDTGDNGDSNANSGDNNASDGGGGSGDDNGGNDGNDNGDNGDNGAQMCSTANLTPGTSVADAVLEVTSSGAIWDKVELITP